ncbi:hypothetical protein LA080_011824 [Diaporthe eres]|uniref:Uncharacterized protein n=1 Tax=Diaporthe vaccinii TaxID=105482 RepID=A0ABR4EI85_9PEZI|nr:hypothetical protein LA080_011824 [Diaporthe eres]
MALPMCSVPAVFEWSDLSLWPRLPVYIGGSETVSVQLCLHLNEEKQSVGFEMQFRLQLEGKTLDETYDPITLWIYHRTVVLLIQDPAHHLPAGVSPVLHGPTTCLRLVLAIPPLILYHKDIALRRQASFQKLLGSLELLTKQKVIAIHVEQRNISSAAALQRFCEVLTNQSIKLRLQPYFAERFHDYAAASLIVHNLKEFQKDGRNDVESASIAPPYADDQEAPPPPLCAQALKKRKWTHADTGTATFNNAELLTQHKLQMEALLASQQTQTQKIQCLMEDLEGIKDLICGRSEFKEVIKQECQEDLKDNLENGLD